MQFYLNFQKKTLSLLTENLKLFHHIDILKKDQIKAYGVLGFWGFGVLGGVKSLLRRSWPNSKALVSFDIFALGGFVGLVLVWHL